MSYTIHELNFIKAAIGASQITGKDAPFVAGVLEKVEKQLAKESKKLEQKQEQKLYIYIKLIIGPKGKWADSSVTNHKEKKHAKLEKGSS